MLYVTRLLILNVVFSNYITNSFNFQAYIGKIFARINVSDTIKICSNYFNFFNFCRITPKKYSTAHCCFSWISSCMAIIGLTFFPVVFTEVEILESVINLFYILLLVLSLVMVLFQDLSISKIGNTVFSTIFSFTIVSFIMSEVFFENLNHIIYLFLSFFFLKTIATFLNVQFSNFQYFFNFFAVLVVMIGVTSFYDFQFIYIILGSVSTALSVVFVNFLILKIRYEFEHISELTNEIYLYDYLIAFLFSLYFVDSLNIINGLF